MWDLVIGITIGVAGAVSGHQQQLPRDVHNIQGCEVRGNNDSCARREFPATVDGKREDIRLQSPADVKSDERYITTINGNRVEK